MIRARTHTDVPQATGGYDGAIMLWALDAAQHTGTLWPRPAYEAETDVNDRVRDTNTDTHR